MRRERGLLRPTAMDDARKKFAAMVGELAKRSLVELGHRVVAVAVDEQLGAVLGVGPDRRSGIRTDVGTVIIEVVGTT